MNKDIRIRTTFPEHPKTKKLIRKLGHCGFYSLVSLWCFTAENKPSGVLKNMDVEDIASAANWTGDAELFVDSLLRCGFLEKDDGGQLCVHDWIEHNAYAAYAPFRSEIARQNVMKRWQKRKSADVCKPASEANLIQSVLPVVSFCNTPSPNPIPTPSPNPTPSPIPNPNPIPNPIPFQLNEEQKKKIEEVLKNAFKKGYSQIEINRYFSEQAKNEIDIETAVRRLIKKIEKKEKLLHYGKPLSMGEVFGGTA